jgi:hypothetical protein
MKTSILAVRQFSRVRFIGSIAAACLSGATCIATLINPHWFELLFDESPDGGDGSLETTVAVVVSLGAGLAFAWLAQRERRRDSPKPSSRTVRTHP